MASFREDKVWKLLVLATLSLGIVSAKNNIQPLSSEDGSRACELPSNSDDLTQEQVISILTNSSCYDKLIKPKTNEPLDVYIQMDLKHIEGTDQTQFRAHMLVQFTYKDQRLFFKDASPKRDSILGQESLRSKIWLPHVVIKNDRDTTVTGFDGKDVFVMISPEGDVIYSCRMIATFYCWMDLRKFPFDTQECFLKWNSWTYNVSDLVLHWDEDPAVRIAENLHLTEFVMVSMGTNSSSVPASFTKGALVGNFSQLIFQFTLAREVGYYIMDYFLPSVLLVCTSWVTFWLQADAGPPRATLGTSTMLTFITLSGGLIKNLPKVSYIKASDIWFVGCSIFIFGSLAEFAFVNVIWRRKKKVELKKQTSKYIIKGAFTPALARRDLRKVESVQSLYTPKAYSLESKLQQQQQQHYLTIHGYPTPPPMNQSEESLATSDNSVSIQIPQDHTNSGHSWHTMTPQEVAIWVDRKSRIVFPVAFIIFNIFYWTFVYVL